MASDNTDGMDIIREWHTSLIERMRSIDEFNGDHTLKEGREYLEDILTHELNA